MTGVSRSYAPGGADPEQEDKVFLKRERFPESTIGIVSLISGQNESGYGLQPGALGNGMCGWQLSGGDNP